MLFSLVTSQFVSILSSSFFQSGGIGNGECWCSFLPLHRSLFQFSLLFFKVEELETVSAGAVFSHYIAVCFDSLFFCFFKVEEFVTVSAGAVFSGYIPVCFDSLFFFFSQLQQEVSVCGPVKSID